MSSLPIEIRQALDIEHPFIYHSWIKSGQRSDATKLIAKEIYTLNQHDIITHILARANVIVAQELNKPESIYGYLVYQFVDGVFVVHYAYVKHAFRSLGILKSLLAAAGFDRNSNIGFYTHVTKNSHYVEAKVNMFYNPYLLSNPKYAVLTSSPKTPVTPAPLAEPEFYQIKDSKLDQSFEFVGLDSQETPKVILRSSAPDIDEDEQELLNRLAKESSNG